MLHNFSWSGLPVMLSESCCGLWDTSGVPPISCVDVEKHGYGKPTIYGEKQYILLMHTCQALRSARGQI